MKKSITPVGVVVAMFAFLLNVGIATAAEIKVLCADGFRHAMTELKPHFERASGHKLEVSFGNLGQAMKRLQGGETADLVILPKQGIDKIVKDGKADAGNITTVARVGIYVAVRKGAPKPNFSSPDALKRMLLAAKSITYLNPAGGGVSGVRFARVLDRLGIANEMKPKTILVNHTREMTPLIENGKVEVVVHQLANLMTVGGIEILGPLPESLQDPLVFNVVVMNSAKDAALAKAFIEFLRSPESAKLIKSKGMDPA